MKNSIFVYGPPGCGKTKNAREIAKLFGLHAILDDWCEGQTIPEKGTLILSQEPPMNWPRDVSLKPYADALKELIRAGKVAG